MLLTSHAYGRTQFGYGSSAAWRTRGLAIPPAVVPGCTRCYSAMGASKRCHMSTKKRWRRPPPAPPRIEDRYWRRAPGGLVGWSGRGLQPDQLIRQHEPQKDAPITATPPARASIGGRLKFGCAHLVGPSAGAGAPV